MWEAPGFTPAWNDPAPPTDLQQLDIFRQQVLMALHLGSGSNHIFGLAELRRSSAGDDKLLSHLMDDGADPHVFIFAPYVRADFGTPNYGNEFPVGLPEAFGQDDGLPSKNQQIENEVKAIFRIPNGTNVPYEKVVYAPRAWPHPLVPEDLSDRNYDSHRGKILVQYQPAKSCQEKASWRVWFEGPELQDSQQSEWVPLANQIATNPQGAVQGRQEPTDSAIACPLPSSMSSGSSSSTSQLPPSISDPPPSTISPSATESLTLSPSSIESLTLSPSTTEGLTLSPSPIKTSAIETTPTASLTMETTPIEIPTSTATTEPTPIPTTVITPLQVFDTACNNEADFPGHGDVSPGTQNEFAMDFSGLDGPDGFEFISSTTPTFERKFEGKHGISYDYSVSWVSGCVTTVDKQSFRFPLAEGDTDVLAGEPARVTAYGLLRAAYTDCNNQGVGGKRQVGCLEYAFTGAK
ncbi:hypothetical protein GGR58DRAFT_488740 [Xylaria digitata]|nr:hypothetical protein GGR58DRAFT_488740 [Xylaria digitata]